MIKVFCKSMGCGGLGRNITGKKGKYASKGKIYFSENKVYTLKNGIDLIEQICY